MTRRLLPLAFALGLFAAPTRAQDATSARADLDLIAAAMSSGSLDRAAMAEIARHLRTAARVVEGSRTGPSASPKSCLDEVHAILRRSMTDATARREAIALCAPVRDMDCMSFAYDTFRRHRANASAITDAAEACSDHHGVEEARFVHAILRR